MHASPDPGAPAAWPQTPPPAYLRMPSVAGGLLAFVCDDDLWTAPLGAASRAA